MPSEEKEKYKKVRPKFTSQRSNRKKRIVNDHGWDECGVAFFNERLKMFRLFRRNKDIWDMFIESWYEYVEQQGFGKHYRKKSSLDLDISDDEFAGPTSHQTAASFALPGDSDFEPDDEEPEDESGDEEDTDEGEKARASTAFLEGDTVTGDVSYAELNNNIQASIKSKGGKISSYDSSSDGSSSDDNSSMGKVVPTRRKSKSDLSQKKRSVSTSP